MKSTKSKNSSDASHVSSPALSVTEKDSFFSTAKQESNSLFGPHFIQPKLKISQPNDKYEQEANRVADQVIRMPEPQVQMQPKKEDEEKFQMHPLEGNSQLQMKPAIQKKKDGTAHASSQVTQQINSSKGRGALMAPKTQRELSHKMGADFSGVNIHTDSKSHQMNRQLGAKAFTHGRDIYFNEGEYNPSSNSGKHLLAHELTHVVQQNSLKIKAASNIQRQIKYEVGPNGELHPIEHQSVTWDTDLGSMLAGAQSSYNPKQLSKIESGLEQELNMFKKASRGLFKNYNQWALEQNTELLQEFKQKMPNFSKAVLGAAFNESLGTLFGSNPATDVAWKVVSFSIGYLKEVQGVQENNSKVARNTEESQQIFDALNNLQGQNLHAIIDAVSHWVAAVQRALGNVEGDYIDLVQREEQIELLEKQEDQEKNISENIEVLRKHIKQDIEQMKYHYGLAESAVVGLRKSRNILVKTGNNALNELTILFDTWQKQRRYYKHFKHDTPMRLFYWHPNTNEIIEIKNKKVSPKPVLVASSPLGTGLAATISETNLSGYEKKLVKDVEGNNWQWGRNFNSNFPHPDKIDSSSSYVRLYVYTGFWPDGVFHIMSKISWTPFQVEIKNGRAVSWDFDKTSHPAMKAFFNKYLPVENTLSLAAGAI